MMMHDNFKKSFTLVELMIVIAILAILSAIVIFALNPSRLFNNFKDTRRITDITMINKAIIFMEGWNTNGINYGISTNVYLSLPDSSSTCSSYALSTLPTGYSYACKPISTYKNSDGTGWIPIDFTVSNNNKYITILPIDPDNDVTYYYSYFPGGSYELRSKLTTTRKEATDDNGVFSNYIELRSTNFHVPTPVVMGNNCLQILNNDANAKSGTYWINPDNDDNAYAVYCDMVNQGGGWTLIFSSQTVPGMADKTGSYDSKLVNLQPSGSMLSTWTPFASVSSIRFACDGNKNGTLDYDGVGTTNGNAIYTQIKNCVNGLCETSIALDNGHTKGINNDSGANHSDNIVYTLGSYKWGSYDDYPWTGNNKDHCNGTGYKVRTAYPIESSTSNAFFYIFVK